MFDGAGALVRVGARVVSIGGLLAVLGYWLAKHARERHHRHLAYAVVGTLLFHLSLQSLTPVFAYPDTTYVWQYAPGESALADARFAQLALLVLVLGVVVYGVRRSRPGVLGTAAPGLVLFAVGVPVTFPYWALFPVEFVLVSLYVSHVADHPSLEEHGTVVRAGIWLAGAALAVLAYAFVHGDSLGHVVVVLFALAGWYSLVRHGERAAPASERRESAGN